MGVINIYISYIHKTNHHYYHCTTKLIFVCLTELQKFGLMGIHVAPNEAVAELRELDEVVQAAKGHWNVDVCILKVYLQVLL